MRFTEVLKAVCNTFIRKKAIIEPEGDMAVTEELEEPEEPEIVAEMAEDKEAENLERRIRRYRAFAYHHKKKRIRKKYLKKLLDISPIDRFIYKVNRGGIALHVLRSGENVIGFDYSSGIDFSPGSIGSSKNDHIDSRLIGGQWSDGTYAGCLRMTYKNHIELGAGFGDTPRCCASWKSQEVLDEKQNAEFCGPGKQPGSKGKDK